MFAIRKLTVPETKIVLVGVSPDPEKPHTLYVRQLSHVNPAVFNEVVKRRSEGPRAYDLERELDDIARLCVARWENIDAADGTPAELTPEHAAEYLRMAYKHGHHDEVLRLRVHVQTPENFGPPIEEAAKLGEG